MPLEAPPRKHLGEILVMRGVLAPARRDAALQAQARTLMPIGSTLLLMGELNERDIALALSEQKGVPAVVLSCSVVDLKVLDLLPKDVAETHRVLPLRIEGHTLHLAMANPDDRTLLDEISFASGRTVLPFVAIRSMLEQTIREAYQLREDGLTVYKGRDAQKSEPYTSIVHPLESPRISEMDSPEIAKEPEAEAVSVQNTEFEVEAAFPEDMSAGDMSDSIDKSSGRTRALVVDDEPEIVELLSKALTARKIDVFKAHRGREALEQLRVVEPDIVLLDAMLPEIHGFEICSKIKASKQFAHTPVIMISAIYTGWNFIQDVKRIYGADEYFSKPFRIVEVVRKVEELVAKTKGLAQGDQAMEAVTKAAEEALAEAARCCKDGALIEWLDAAKRAVRADPFDPRTHFMLGSALHRAGKLYEAISEYERVVELAPGQFSALKNLAVLYERQGFKAKAVEMWTRALNQSPSEPVRQTIKAHLISLL